MNYWTFSETHPTRRRQIIVFYASRCSNLTVYLQQQADERESDDDLVGKLCKRIF